MSSDEEWTNSEASRLRKKDRIPSYVKANESYSDKEHFVGNSILIEGEKEPASVKDRKLGIYSALRAAKYTPKFKAIRERHIQYQFDIRE
ncbi:hypothetical protein X798_01986 [Onchocerca flexuosa]|uniref:Uncharacterized protein n=2 Tax=Onchocerca flexuosa TaxID=387005 RepID=A0A183GYA0_9BILA|nr:hypothetical protein X798_01986 [Onchocerca flexuosa]VDO25003.1 unnamed protein product [Onchocerca flexuosa]